MDLDLCQEIERYFLILFSQQSGGVGIIISILHGGKSGFERQVNESGTTKQQSWPLPPTRTRYSCILMKEPFSRHFSISQLSSSLQTTARQLMPVQCWWVVTVQCWWEGSFIAGLWLLLLKSSSNDWGTSDSLDFRSLHFGVSWSASLIAHTSCCALHTRCFSRSGEVTDFLVSDLLLYCPPYRPLVPHVQVGYLLKTGSISKVFLLCPAWPSSGPCELPGVGDGGRLPGAQWWSG